MMGSGSECGGDLGGTSVRTETCETTSLSLFYLLGFQNHSLYL